MLTMHLIKNNGNSKCFFFVGRELAVSWALCAVCLFGHLSHIFGAKASWIHVFHSTGLHLSLSLFTLLGPGRQLILEGLKSLFKGAPNMNTLVGLGALSSFTVSSLAALIPKLVSGLSYFLYGSIAFILLLHVTNKYMTCCILCELVFDMCTVRLFWILFVWDTICGYSFCFSVSKATLFSFMLLSSYFL